MVFKWNDKNTLLFLECFKNYQCLWNHKLDEYKDKTIRANSMKSLITDLNLEVTEDDIKNKIKTIRTRYTTELTKTKQSTKSGCSSDDVYVPSLYWFNYAEFLSSVCVPRQSTSNLDATLKKHVVSQVTPNEGSAESEENEYSQTASEEQKTPNCERNRSESSESMTPFHSRKPIKRKRKIDMPIDRAIKELKILSEQNKEQTEDEFDLFCKSLAVQLKKMPLSRALICQEKLQSVMTQERLTHMSQPLCESIYSDSSTQSPFSINRSPQYDNYYVIQQQVRSPTGSVLMNSPNERNEITVAQSSTQENIVIEVPQKENTVPQHNHYYATPQRVHSPIVSEPMSFPQQMNEITVAQTSTQENILAQAVRSIM